MDAAGWDARYADSPLVWSAGPNALFAEVTAGWRPGRALDVAAGEGRTAIWLAEQGWQVRALDFSAVGVDKGRRIAEQRGVGDRVEWVVADATTADLGTGYDLVALLYLHLPHDQQAAVVGRCLRALAPGGRLVVVAHDRDNVEHGVGGPQDVAVLPTAELLRRWADGASVERAEQVTRETDAGTAIDVLLVARA